MSHDPIISTISTIIIYQHPHPHPCTCTYIDIDIHDIHLHTHTHTHAHRWADASICASNLLPLAYTEHTTSLSLLEEIEACIPMYSRMWYIEGNENAICIGIGIGVGVGTLVMCVYPPPLSPRWTDVHTSPIKGRQREIER